jgi:hypothetical protein
LREIAFFAAKSRRDDAAFASSRLLPTDVTDPVNPMGLGSNLTLQATVTDRSEPGSSDAIGVTIWNGNKLLFSSEWDGAQTVEGLVHGGNIVVH